MFYLVRIIFIFLVSILVNIPSLYTVFFNDIFYANNITNIFDNNLYIRVYYIGTIGFHAVIVKVTGK